MGSKALQLYLFQTYQTLFRSEPLPVKTSPPTLPPLCWDQALSHLALFHPEVFSKAKVTPLPLHHPDDCHIVSGSEHNRNPDSIQEIGSFDVKLLPGSETNLANKSNLKGRIKSKTKSKHKRKQITPEHHQMLDNKTIWQRRETEAGINIWGWRWGWLGAGETQEG